MSSNKQDGGRGIWAWDLVQTIIALSTLLFLWFLYRYGFSEEGLRRVIRWTARIDVFLFCMAFSASAAHLLIRNSFSFWWKMNRKFFGISFALLHLIHLAFLGLLQLYFHPVFEQAAGISLMAGGLAYFFIVSMLLTSFPFFAKWISSENWRRLHTFGAYWIWLIFMTTTWKAIMEGMYKWIPTGVVLVLVLLLRLWALYKKRTY
jgi:hypothetical protein